jgi:hypothetical protein
MQGNNYYYTLFFCVADLLTFALGNDIAITELSQNTVFLKTKDILLTNDAWKIVVNFDLSNYEELLSKLMDDLNHIHEFKSTYTPVN